MTTPEKSEVEVVLETLLANDVRMQLICNLIHYSTQTKDHNSHIIAWLINTFPCRMAS